MSAPGTLGATAIKPVERHGWEAVKFFFYDTDKGTIMGRKGKSWFLITVFYLIYYTCLALFFALMMFIFLLTVSDEEPKYQGSASIIGTSPGVGIRPQQPDSTISSSMIIFNKDSRLGTDDVPGYETWTENMHRFLSYYRTDGPKCKVGSHRDPFKLHERQDEVCTFDTSQLKPCAKKNYGYDKGQPCVLVKLNKLFGVQNDYYNGTRGTEFDPDMPQELVSHIQKEKKAGKDVNQVWLDCHGENPADVEALGPIKYYPESRGFPAYYFPYENKKGYMSPVVAVQFTKPTLGQLLHVECRAWARNIGYNRADRIGMVHFELFVLDKERAELYEKSVA